MGLLLGVDVGTGSARAGIFDPGGRLLSTASSPIATFDPVPGFAQQEASGIWRAVCAAVREAVASAGAVGGSIRGIGFDATCSLVVTDSGDRPVSVDPGGEPEQNVILWMDHRAINDATAITATGARVLEHVGGSMSPEMELPKLRWLKRELPGSWRQAERFWDLPDWLAHRASGTTVRSLCSATCKWTYLAHHGMGGEGWDPEFLASIGLEEFARDGFSSIGNRFAAAGTLAGTLTEASARELGLAPGIAVSTSLIDAYAGALGTLGVGDGSGIADLDGRLAVIAGMSACHISVTREPRFVSGVWGPYHSVLFDDRWVNEGGQSAAGALLDAIIARHSASSELAARCATRPAEALELVLSAHGDEAALLARQRHVQPDFHGNRSPLAEPWRQGSISGLTLAAGIEDLALDYLAGQQALAYGTRHIIEALQSGGVAVDTLVVSGGLARSSLYLREHADATGCRLLVPDQPEPVLLGSAMLAATASGAFRRMQDAVQAMSGTSTSVEPRHGRIATYHDAKYSVFRRMQDDHAAYAELMAAADGIQQEGHDDHGQYPARR